MFGRSVDISGSLGSALFLLFWRVRSQNTKNNLGKNCTDLANFWQGECSRKGVPTSILPMLNQGEGKTGSSSCWWQKRTKLYIYLKMQIFWKFVHKIKDVLVVCPSGASVIDSSFRNEILESTQTQIRFQTPLNQLKRARKFILSLSLW